MKIAEITPVTLKDADQAEVLSLHRRLHELWSLHFEHSTINTTGELSREDVFNAHAFIVAELERRGFEHASPLRSIAHVDLAETIVVVPSFVSLAGSTAARGPGQADVDVVLRTESDGDNRMHIWSDNIYLPLRKTLDPDKRGLLHFILNPQGPHAEHIPLYDLALIRRAPARLQLALEHTYRTMKPSMAGYTEFFSTDELWEKWAKEKLAAGHALLGSPKIDGFRSVLWSEDGKVVCRFEDTPTPRHFDIALPAGLLIEGEFTAKHGDQWLARTQLMAAAEGRIDATPHWFLYDLLEVEGRDIHALHFSDRLHILTLHANANFTVLEQRPVHDAASLQAVGQWAASQPLSEGLYLRQADAPYVFGSTDTAAKMKTIFELKVIVLEIIPRENGHVYHCGLREPGDFTNTIEHGGAKYLDLGNTFVTTQHLADAGDTLNVRVEEIIQSATKLFWGKPTPINRDATRPAYTIEQVIDLAKRAHVFKAEVRTEQAAPSEDETRGERATAFWAAHWHESFPPGGRGAFVYHHHWRGLPKELTTADEAQLLLTDHSVHGDLRLSFGPALWGFTCFLGTTADVRGGRDLATLRHDDALQGTFKLHQPKAWLTIARDKPYLSEPGGVGGTSQAWAKFFEKDHGQYDVGVWREHLVEIFLHGNQLHGRFLIVFAAIGGSRKWIIQRPAEQTAYADQHSRESVIAELKAKHQRYLVWAKPGLRPELIEI